MWKMLLFAFIEYIVIGIFLPIDASKSKASRRLKRFIKLLLWVVTGIVVNYLMRENSEYAIYLMISVCFVINYFLEIINPYLGEMFTVTITSGLLGAGAYFFWFEQHPVIIGVVILFFVATIIFGWKEAVLNMRRGLDADVEREKEEEENRNKISIFKIFKVVRFVNKIRKM